VDLSVQNPCMVVVQNFSGVVNVSFEHLDEMHMWVHLCSQGD
jgi:hypothetical protein